MLSQLVHLLAVDVPVLLSCYNAREAEGEAALLGIFGANVLRAHARNPFGHAVPDGALAPAGSAHAEARLANEAREAADARSAEADCAELDNGGRADEAGGPSVCNALIAWVRGSSYGAGRAGAAAMGAEVVPKARDFVAACAKMFALRNMEAWVAGVGGGAPMETVAANASLLSAAVDESPIALHALKLGARDALIAAAARASADLGASARPSADGAQLDGAALSYTGAAAAERVAASCADALGRLARVERMLASLCAEPAEAEAPLAPPAVHEVTFGGDYVNVRTRPLLGAPVARQMRHGDTCIAAATRGAWLRLEGGGWLLTHHPAHGTLVAARSRNIQ